MATFSYVQTDTTASSGPGVGVGCSGQSIGKSSGGRTAEESGTAGSSEFTIDPDNETTAACAWFDCEAPGVSSWAAGDYVIPVNHTTMDAATTLTRVDVCDFDGSTFQSVANNTSPGHSAGGTGVTTVTVNRATAYSPQNTSLSRVFVVLTYNNTDPHGGSTGGITPSETITTPIVVGGGGGDKRRRAIVVS